MALGMEVGRVFTTLGFKVDDGNASAYERRVNKLRGDSHRDITQKARVDADTRGIDNYEKRIRDVDRAHGDLVRGTGRVRGAFGSLFFGGAGVAAAGIAVVGATKGVQALTGAFEESRRVGAQTNVVLKSTNHEAGLTAKEVGNLATAISRKTAIDDEAVQSAENVLLTFTNVRNEAGRGNDVFNQATKTIADMSVALGTDLQGSTIQVGKALNDPIKGITALSRVGVSFTKQQKEQIKTLVDSGRTLDAQKIILKELGKEFGGSAASAATNSGKMRVALGNVAETIGGKLNPYVQKGAGYITRFIDQMTTGRGAGGRFAKTAGEVGDAVRTGLGTAFDFAGRAIRSTERFIRDNRARLEDLGDTVRDVARTVTRFIGQIADVMQDTFGAKSGTGRDIRSIIGVLLLFENTVMRLFTAIVRRALPGIVTAFRGMAQIIRGVIRIIAGVLTGDFGKAWDGVKDVFSGGIKLVAGVLRAATAPFRAAAAGIGRAVSGAFSSAWNGIVGTAQGFVNKIIDVINIIPGVNIGHVGGGGSKTSSDGNSRTGAGRVGNFAEGGKVTMPIAIMGEEAPTHPEWVIPTNPAYRQRAVGLWMAAARELAIPGFKAGGVLGAVQDAAGFAASLPGRAVGSVGNLAGYFADRLPGNPGGILGGTFGYVLDKVKDYIAGKAKGLFSSVTSALGGGGGGAVSATGLVAQVQRALAWARGHGWHGTVTSGLRSTAKQQALWDGAPGNGLVRGVTVARPGTSSHERGQAVDVTDIPGFQHAMASAPPGSRLLWRGPSDPVHFSISGHRRGGILGLIGGLGGQLLASGALAYRKGGRRPAKKRAPAPTLTSSVNRGIKRSVARGESGIRSYEDDIQGLERQYGQMDRRFGLSDETFIIENDDGSTTVDHGAVNARVGELTALIAKREEIKRKIEAYRRAIARLMRELRAAIKQLQKALKAAKGSRRQKERAGYRQSIGDYQHRLSELKGTHTDLGLDVEDQRIDLDELGKERATVAGSTGAAAPVDASAPATDDASVAGAPATDPAVDPAPAPPTAEDIARAAAEQLATFNAGRQDLFSSFGSTMEGARAIASGAVFADSERRAAGLRAFGAFGNETLQPAAAAAGSQIVIHQQFDAPPPDPHIWAQGVRFEIEGAIG